MEDFGSPVDIDGKVSSCVDVLLDLPGDADKLWALHPNLADDAVEQFIAICKSQKLPWERGARRFYVIGPTALSAVVGALKAAGIECALCLNAAGNL